jgi:hypothetical protein
MHCIVKYAREKLSVSSENCLCNREPFDRFADKQTVNCSELRAIWPAF